MLTTQPAASTAPRSTRTPRLAICPPERGRLHWIQRLQGWLCAGWPITARAEADVHGPTPALECARDDFLDALRDLRSPGAELLREQIHFTRSMRELWHLRTEIFSLLALHHDQLEADTRLAGLNRHFPTRSPRSGFAPLAATPVSTPAKMWP